MSTSDLRAPSPTARRGAPRISPLPFVAVVVVVVGLIAFAVARSEWRVISPDAAGARVELPASPERSEGMSILRDGREAYGETIVVRGTTIQGALEHAQLRAQRKGERYYFAWCDLPRRATVELDEELILRKFARQGHLAGGLGDVGDLRPLSSPLPGVEAEFPVRSGFGRDMTATKRVYLSRALSRVYVLVFAASGDDLRSGAAASRDRFFDSFEIDGASP